MVNYHDRETDANLTFITNHTELSTLEVTNLYRNRWQIETSFKWIKQDLTIRSFWGYTEKAVKTHLWVAICTYLIVARIKAKYGDCPYTISEVATLLSVSALEKISLRELLTSNLLDSNQDVNELF